MQKVASSPASEVAPCPDNPDYDSYNNAITAATALFDREAINTNGNSRRGDFVAITAGVSYGGGQQVRYANPH
jgi:hypothetical protein